MFYWKRNLKILKSKLSESKRIYGKDIFEEMELFWKDSDKRVLAYMVRKEYDDLISKMREKLEIYSYNSMIKLIMNVLNQVFFKKFSGECNDYLLCFF